MWAVHIRQWVDIFQTCPYLDASPYLDVAFPYSDQYLLFSSTTFWYDVINFFTPTCHDITSLGWERTNVLCMLSACAKSPPSKPLVNVDICNLTELDIFPCDQADFNRSNFFLISSLFLFVITHAHFSWHPLNISITPFSNSASFSRGLFVGFLGSGEFGALWFGELPRELTL